MVDEVTNLAMEYQVQINDDTTNQLITGYEVTCFGVPMIGQYVNTGRGRSVTISPAVPGAQYRISDGKKVYTCMYRGFYKIITIVLLMGQGGHTKVLVWSLWSWSWSRAW